jgi:hypothetical protein
MERNKKRAKPCMGRLPPFWPTVHFHPTRPNREITARLVGWLSPGARQSISRRARTTTTLAPTARARGPVTHRPIG